FPLERPARIAVFASGTGSNFKVLMAEYPQGDPLGSVELLITDRKAAGALALAEEAGIASRWIRFNPRERFELAADLLLREERIDLICLAGFMRILSPWFVARW